MFFQMKGECRLKTKVRRFSIRWKILIPITTLITAMCVILGVNAYNRMKTGMIQLGVEEAQMAAAMAQTVVNGDDLAGMGEDFENTDEYQRILADLRQVKNICGIAFLYTLHTDDNSSLYYGIDTDESAGQRHPGDVYENRYAEFADVFAGQEYVQDYIQETIDGTLISAYLPIWDSAGKVVAVLGCDYDASYVADRIRAACGQHHEESEQSGS